MVNIDLTNISKDELLKLWESANTITTADTKVKTNKQIMNEYIDWLESGCFGNELMNDLGYELGTCMTSVYVHGAMVDEWDECGNYLGEKKYEVDKINPNTKGLFEFCLEGLKNDTEYLKEFGITKKKLTKKMPYSFNDIDWTVFKNENILN